MLNLATATRKDVLAYFENGWDITETLFSALQDDSTYYLYPDKLRHPLIFYFAHPAVFYINKFREAELIQESERIDPYFETIFAVGVDEMSWDDYGRAATDWPAVSAVREYRKKAHEKIVEVIMTAEFNSPISWDQAYWAIPMGMEHERIHIETSSVLVRQLPVNTVKRPRRWPAYAPVNNDVLVKNKFVEVPDAVVELGKARNFPSYGWDNEYGKRVVTVPAFKATKFLITNAEFLEFVKAGGYKTEKYWEEEGWNWRTFRQAECPTFWVPDGDTYRLRVMCDEIDMPWNWPVEVNWLEAHAYCRWRGPSYRVITEAEWHRLRGDTPAEYLDKVEADVIFRQDFPGNGNLRYGSSTAVDAYPPTSAGFYDVHGNTWEWTEDQADGLPGFKVHPFYLDFSTPCYDGRHNLIMGGSWVSTGNQASIYARYWFRRHFFQHLGFRLAQTIDPISENLYPLVDNPHKIEVNRWINEKNPYEQKKILEDYLQLHYAPDDELCPYSFGGLKDIVTSFPARCAQECAKHALPSSEGIALDIGCAVGRASFELARTFKSVIGLDYSRSFVQTATTLKERGSLRYRYIEEGRLWKESNAVVDPDIDRTRVTFICGDACNLPDDLGKFDAVLLANLIDRLPDPVKCLEKLPLLVKSGGVAVITSPYTWMEQYTPSTHWLGGYHYNGKDVRTFDWLQEFLSPHFELVEQKDMPLLIREHVRKFQLCVAHASIWRRK